jgi:hypothetical protein
MRSLRFRYGEQHVTQTHDPKLASILHRIFSRLELVRQRESVAVRIREFDEFTDLPFSTFRCHAASPLDSCGTELAFPL